VQSADLCARYILAHLARRWPARWLSSPRRNFSSGSPGQLVAELKAAAIDLTFRQEHRLATLDSVEELFRAYYFRGVALDSHEGMVGWIEGRYPLTLLLDVPTPNEMLAYQCLGRRYVTLPLRECDQLRPHGRHADACDFLLHDLEHAHKFFADAEIHRGQVRFFRALQISLPAFAQWEEDSTFVKDLDYLKSDMNSHPVHLVKFLKAIVLSAEIRRTQIRHPQMSEFWEQLFGAWGMSAQTLASSLAINHPEVEVPEDLLHVREFFCAPQTNLACETSRQAVT